MTESQAQTPASAVAQDAPRPLNLARNIGKPFLDAVPNAIPVLIGLSACLAAVYFASIAYGAAVGHALPTATVFRTPYPEVIVRFEASLPRLLLIIALAGTTVGWLSRAGLVDEALMRRQQSYGVKLLRGWGLLIVGAIFVLGLTCSANWDGNLRLHWASWDAAAGLIPLADAHGYFESPVHEALTGNWNDIATRRPLAAGFRQLLMMTAGFSLVGTLLLQTILLAAAASWAIRSVIVWRGLWCGIAFGALVYGVAREFISTMLTEPLGLFWALLSVAFTVEALRLKSLPHAFLALTTLTVAEFMRMGSLFTIPAFVVWIAIAFGADFKERTKLLAAGAAFVGLVIAIQSALAAIYGSASGLTGANFSETLCGLAAGRDWTACPQLYAQEFKHLATDREQAAFLTAKAFQLMKETPYPMLARMLANVRDVVVGTPQLLLYGMDGYHRPYREILFVVVLIPGLWLAWRTRIKGEASFWALLFTSVVGSAALIYADNGWRALHVTWPLIALFLSLGFISPGTATPESRPVPLISSRAGLSLVVALIALTIAAPAMARIWPGAEFREFVESGQRQAPQSAILDGRTLTGILVVSNNAPLPDGVPAMNASNFAQLVKKMSLEDLYGRFMDRAMARVPFAMITAVRLDMAKDDHQSWNFLIAPPDVLTKKSELAWFAEFEGAIGGQGEKIVPEIRSVRPLGGGPKGHGGIR